MATKKLMRDRSFSYSGSCPFGGKAIKNDRHAKVIPFEKVYRFLGYDRYDVAVKQLKKLFPGIEASSENLHPKVEVSRTTRGPSKAVYLISVRQFETLMLAAKTEEGALAREMMLWQSKQALRSAVSPAKARPPLPANVTMSAEEDTSTPLTRFVLGKLDGPSKDLFAMSFAAQMSMDKHALVIDLADALPWLGIDRIDVAVRLLKRHFQEGEYKVESFFHSSVENSRGRGRPGLRHFISLDMFDDLLMLCETKQGREARKMYKQLRDAVQDFMKEEMKVCAERAQRELQEQLSKLAIEEAKRQELEIAVEKERERKAKMTARKADEDVAGERVYLMASQGLLKIGLTCGDVAKRQKQMETGNPDINTVFCIDCIDARLVERNMHFMLRWYKRKGEWYDIDLSTASFLLKLTVAIFDGIRRTELDEVDVPAACEALLGELELNCCFPSQTVDSPEEEQRPETVETDDRYGEFIRRHYELTGCPDDHVVYADLTGQCKAWMEGHDIYRNDEALAFSRDDLKARMVHFTGRHPKNQRPPNNKKLPTRKCWTGVRTVDT